MHSWIGSLLVVGSNDLRHVDRIAGNRLLIRPWIDPHGTTSLLIDILQRKLVFSQQPAVERSNIFREHLTAASPKLSKSAQAKCRLTIPNAG
jgi:hemolysin-activating ACP:hemolysin acyltransferase